MLNHARPLLQAGNNRAGEGLAAEQYRARLPQYNCERGLRQEDLYSTVLRADPQTLTHITAKRPAWLVSEMTHLTHDVFDETLRRGDSPQNWKTLLGG